MDNNEGGTWSNNNNTEEGNNDGGRAFRGTRMAGSDGFKINLERF